MPETFAPTVLQNDQGQKLNADYFNRLETNLETFDDRIAAVEAGVTPPLTVSYAAAVDLDASLGALFRITATGNVSIANILGGIDGQKIEVQVNASGADRVLTLAGGTTSIPVTNWWIGQLRYIGPDNFWVVTAEIVVAPSGPGSSYSSNYTPNY